jgi:hypothetical protein
MEREKKVSCKIWMLSDYVEREKGEEYIGATYSETPIRLYGPANKIN